MARSVWSMQSGEALIGVVLGGLLGLFVYLG